jgi:putative nucleotidyltransferase with HDIG domain
VMRVLFVDDEQPVLDGLRVRLRALRDKWETAFADSGPSALEMMKERAFDVIVSDMRMPEMDGARLLRTVSERWPQTVRIVLSGYSELDQTVRLVPVAHQYLSKPCDLAALANIIERCMALKSVLGQPELRSLVGQLRQLPPVPATYAKLQQAMAVESVSVRDVAAIVSRDTVIAAKLMQMVNSAFFRLPRRIDDIEQAVSYLGLAAVRNLAVSAEVFAKWPRASAASGIDLEGLQVHTLNVAAGAHALARDLPFASDALLAAMLHDIGYWVLVQQRADDLHAAVRLATAERLPLDEAERRVLGASHAEIGAYLLGLWGLPNTVVEAAAYHHRPREVPQTGFDVLAAVCVAHALTEPTESRAFPNLPVVHAEVDPEYLVSINAPFDWSQAARRVADSVAPAGGKL